MMNLRAPRTVALIAIAVLVTAASAVSFAESFRGLYLWAAHHGLSGRWAVIWPLQIDVFIAIGECALFVALADGWSVRSRTGAWLVTLFGLAVSVAGNVGHVAISSAAYRLTAAVPPLAAAAALAVGLGVLKRVVAARVVRTYDATDLLTYCSPWDTGTEPVRPVVPGSSEEAAISAFRASVAGGNPLSERQLADRFGITRLRAKSLRIAQSKTEHGGRDFVPATAEVAQQSNGHAELEAAR